jgi:hypothetical protein
MPPGALAAGAFDGGSYVVRSYYQDAGRWTSSNTLPSDNRPIANNIWAAFTAAERASQQNLDWSNRNRVFGRPEDKDAEVALRGSGMRDERFGDGRPSFGRGGVIVL